MQYWSCKVLSITIGTFECNALLICARWYFLRDGLICRACNAYTSPPIQSEFHAQDLRWRRQLVLASTQWWLSWIFYFNALRSSSITISLAFRPAYTSLAIIPEPIFRTVSPRYDSLAGYNFRLANFPKISWQKQRRKYHNQNDGSKIKSFGR